LKPIPRSFYLRPTLEVALSLLGKNFIRLLGDSLLVGKIVEVEAYGAHDPASHSFRGKTQRNEVMFWEGGRLYVYFTYGMHYCVNVVTGKENIGEAVLIRAIEPISGIEIMFRNRFPHQKSQILNHQSLMNLTNGPAKFAQAFGLGKSENGIDLLESEIAIADNEDVPSKLIGRSSRIGIRNGIEKKWRFFIKGNPWVSR
jgi:DNA-3-methyladenine glycosylase